MLKLGVFPNRPLMRPFLRAVDGLAEGGTLVNGISRTILHRDGQPAFGPNFPTAGVLRRATHRPALTADREVHAFIKGLAIEVVALGDVAPISDFADVFEGAVTRYCVDRQR